MPSKCLVSPKTPFLVGTDVVYLQIAMIHDSAFYRIGALYKIRPVSCQFTRAARHGPRRLQVGDMEFWDIHFASYESPRKESKMPKHVNWFLTLFHIIHLTLPILASHELPTCNTNPYGRLDGYDCSNLLQEFADAADDQLRIFDEEQLRADNSGSWPGIRNPFRTSVVQIPRFWSRSAEADILLFERSLWLT